MDTEMAVNSQRAKQLLENFSNVTQRINAVNATKRPVRRISIPHIIRCGPFMFEVRLILVSKLKPASDILALHRDHGEAASHFGENYLQELQEKASLLPKTIKWHFIGGLQSDKCKPLAERIPNLWCVSSVDTTKKADQLEKGRRLLVEQNSDSPATSTNEKLRVMVQVNTSGEDSKSGVTPANTLDLCRHIHDSCPHLHLSGLMTIGALARSKESTPETENEDFECLRQTRDQVAHQLGVAADDLELSMGMSSDFEAAITQGSDEVRIGSTIFGDRPPRSEFKVVGDVAETKS